MPLPQSSSSRAPRRARIPLVTTAEVMLDEFSAEDYAFLDERATFQHPSEPEFIFNLGDVTQDPDYANGLLKDARDEGCSKVLCDALEGAIEVRCAYLILYRG